MRRRVAGQVSGVVGQFEARDSMPVTDVFEEASREIRSRAQGTISAAHLVQPQTRLAFAVLAVALKLGRLSQ
jgi:hypothetical protein